MRVCRLGCATLVVFLVAGALGGCASRLFPLPAIDLPALEQARARSEALLRQHAGFPAVLLLHERTVEHEVMPGSGYWTLHETWVRRHLVLDHHASEAVNFQLRLQPPHQLIQADLLVLPPAGPPRRYGRADLVRQELAKGEVSYRFAYPAVTRGTIIEEHVELNSGDQLRQLITTHLAPVQFSWPCLLARLNFALPERWGLRLKRLGADAPLSVQVDARGDKRVIRYERRDVPGLRREPFRPYDREDGAYAHFLLTSASTSRRAYYGPTDWAALGKRVADELSYADPLLSSRVSDTARRLTAGLAEPGRRMQAVLAHVQQTIRASEAGEGKDFADVLKSGHGSPRQIAGLTVSLLRRAGIKAELVLIHSARGGTFDERFISLAELDTPGVLVELMGRPVLVLPHLPRLPIGLIPPELQGRPALRIDTKGFAGFLTTPVLDASHDQQDTRVEVRITGEGVEVLDERTLRGLAAYRERERLRKLRPDERERRLREELSCADSGVALKSAEVVGLEERDRPLLLRWRFAGDALLTRAPGEAVLRTACLLTPRRRGSGSATGRRTRPVHVHRDERTTQLLEVRAPTTWTLRTPGERVQLRNAFGEAEAQVESSPGHVLFRATATLRRGEHPAQDYSLLQELLRARRARLPAVVFKIE